MTEPNISIEQKKEEAVLRMKKLGIFPETIKQFKNDGYISISEPPMGAFYWAEGEDLEHIREFEREYNALVYVVIRTYFEFGVTDSYLYVSDYEEEWEEDRADCESGVLLAYVYNRSDPELSEIGSIGIEKTIAAGLKRVW